MKDVCGKLGEYTDWAVGSAEVTGLEGSGQLGGERSQGLTEVVFSELGDIGPACPQAQIKCDSAPPTVHFGGEAI